MTTRKSILLAIFLALTILHPAVGLWDQTLSEEFTSATRINSSLWIPAFYWQPDPSPNVAELQTYRPDALNFSSSTSLGIQVSSLGPNSYSSGVITTKDRWTQAMGYFEFRARFPTAIGVMASFSLLPQDTKTVNDSVSLQIVLSNPRQFFMTQQCGTTTRQTTSQLPNITDLSFHKFGLELAINATNLYIDNVLVSSQVPCAVLYTQRYIATSLVVGSLAGSPTSSTVFPVTMEIDYIRAYSYSSFTGVTLPGPGAGWEDFQVEPLDQPQVTLSEPSISSNIAYIGDTVTFNITITGGGPYLSLYPALNQTFVQISFYQFSDTNKRVVSTDTDVTLYRSAQRTFTATLLLTDVTVGYYRFALDIYQAFSAKIIGFNTVEVLQVVAVPAPTAPLSPPISPPVSPPVSPPLSPPVPSPVPLPAPISPPVTPPMSPSVTSNVIPILDCYSPINTTHYRAYFSYNNKNGAAVSLPVGDRNKFTPGSINRGQPTVFNTGRSALFPDSVFVADIDSNVAWALSSYTLDVDTKDTSTLCPNSVTIVIVVSSPSPLNETTTNDLKDIIASQLNVTSDSIQINVTCTSATSCEITVTITADPSQLSGLIQKAKTYVTDPATVENTVKQVSTGLSVTEVRGTKTNTEKVGYSNPDLSPQSLLSTAQGITLSLPFIGLCILLTII